jgi:tRNA A37 threonylcarbamoyladenosine synthetase subunit TsaC/SUA5/YrdC
MSIYLAQTDTTVGFLSADAFRLEEIKSRPSGKQFLKVYPSFEAFQADLNRAPQKYKNLIRRSKKTTFIIKNRASRIVNTLPHQEFLKDHRWLYSTSANQSGKGFDKDFCISKSDIIIEDQRGFEESTPSTLYKLSKTNLKRLR